jgi:flagellar basal body-associated protein FliL
LGEVEVSKDDDKQGAGEKKSKKGLIIGISVGVVVLAAGLGAGLVFGPKLLAGPATAEASGEHKPEKAEHAKEPEKPEKIISSKFEPIIVDLRDSEGALRHLKVGLAAELPETVPEEEFKLLQPRGREAAVAYLRTLSFDQATDPKKYPKVKKDLSKKVLSAIGKEHILRLLIVDYVAQ